jgi:hypothetical protein
MTMAAGGQGFYGAADLAGTGSLETYAGECDQF